MAKGFEIQTGQDLARQLDVERQRERLGGSRELTYGELQQNCETLSRWVSSKVPPDVGYALVLFPADSAQIGVTGSNVDSMELLEKVLEKAQKRVRKNRTSGGGA